MDISRRTLLAATGTVVAASALASPNLARAASPLELPPLPFEEGALAPVISARTVALHYGKHHRGYFEKLNKLLPGTRFEGMELRDIVTSASREDSKERKIYNNAAQAWNHVLYWDQFQPRKSELPMGQLRSEIDAAFGDYDGLIKACLSAADDVFGTGWIWLTRGDDGKLAVLGYEDADNPITSGKQGYLAIDVWEHAFYLDYQNRKSDHISAVLQKLVNWEIVEERLTA